MDKPFPIRKQLMLKWAPEIIGALLDKSFFGLTPNRLEWDSDFLTESVIFSWQVLDSMNAAEIYNQTSPVIVTNYSVTKTENENMTSFDPSSGFAKSVSEVLLYFYESCVLGTCPSISARELQEKFSLDHVSRCPRVQPSSWKTSIFFFFCPCLLLVRRLDSWGSSILCHKSATH